MDLVPFHQMTTGRLNEIWNEMKKNNFASAMKHRKIISHNQQDLLKKLKVYRKKYIHV